MSNKNLERMLNKQEWMFSQHLTRMLSQKFDQVINLNPVAMRNKT